MNTISPPPQIKRLSAGKRVLGVFAGIAGGLGANVLLGYGVMSFYTRNTKFVPYDTSHSDLATAVFKQHNPSSNPPVCIDHAIKQIPYAKLPEKYRLKGDTVDQALLATDFCRGIWSGLGFRVQRRFLERKYRALPGREDHLWDVKALEKSGYEIGTKITDHFEVVEHTKEKVGACVCAASKLVLIDCFHRSLYAAATRLSTLTTGLPMACSQWKLAPMMHDNWRHSV
jgi:hypothetical protein